MSDGAVDLAKLLNKLEVGAGADVDAADVLVASEVVVGVLSCVFPMLGNRLLEGASAEDADIPELLGGLLKNPKALGAVVGDDTEVIAEDCGWLALEKLKAGWEALGVCAVDAVAEDCPPRLENRVDAFGVSDWDCCDVTGLVAPVSWLLFIPKRFPASD